jgi:hypothetical protein
MERNRDDLAALIRDARLPVLVYSYTLPAPSQVEVLNELGLPWYVTTRGVANALEALAWAGGQAAGDGG